MPKWKYTPEQIIRKLRAAEVLISQGMTTTNAARQIGVTEQTYYRWRKEYGGMRISQAKQDDRIRTAWGWWLRPRQRASS